MSFVYWVLARLGWHRRDARFVETPEIEPWDHELVTDDEKQHIERSNQERRQAAALMRSHVRVVARERGIALPDV